MVDRDIVDGDGAGVEVNLRPSQMLDRQTFVFSATLTVPDNVRRKLKKRQAKMYAAGGDDTSKGKKAAEKAAASGAQAGTLGALMEAVPLTAASNSSTSPISPTPSRSASWKPRSSARRCASRPVARVFVFVSRRSFSTLALPGARSTRRR